MSDRQRDILLLFSHQLELSACVDAIRARSYVPFRAERVGVGPSNARDRTGHLLEELGGHCIVLALGSAGWLIPRRPPTAPVWAVSVKSESGREMRPTLAVPDEIIRGFGWASARAVTVSRPVTDAERAVTLASRVNAEMVDMESSAILGQCIDRRVPCGVLRIVSDYANAEAMHAYKDRAPKVLGTLGAEAARLVELLHEREAARLARKP